MRAAARPPGGGARLFPEAAREAQRAPLTAAALPPESGARVPPSRPVLAVLLAAALAAGCASSAIDAQYDGVRALVHARTGAELRWLRSDAAREESRAEVQRLLAEPLDADGAVRIALAHSPALQAMLYEGAARAAATAQSTRLPNPVFAFERMARSEGGVREIEITRMLSFSLFDLLLWPARLQAAEPEREAGRLALSAQVLGAAADTRRAWIDAVAARETLVQADAVRAAAEAGAELARRMQAAGNFSRLQRAREQAFYADAAARHAEAQQAARASWEALVRQLGLADAQAAALRLPDRLPPLPAAARDEASVMQAAADDRLDLRIARAQAEQAARAQGLAGVLVGVSGSEIGLAHKRESGRADQKGGEIALPLPLFDTGDAARAGADATTMAAIAHARQVALVAGSQLRERYGAYRTAHDLARHYRDEVVPLQKAIADENLLRYNGMFIGVFELLAGTREQIDGVMQSIAAQRAFWLADADLEAALLGLPEPQ